MLKHHYPQVLFKYVRYSMSLLTQKKRKITADFFSTQNYAEAFNSSKRKKIHYYCLRNYTFTHRIKFKCHFSVENSNLCYCDDWMN